MKIHEYQGKGILRRFDVAVPAGMPAFSVEEAVEAARKLGGEVWVVKAQIHAGGRGQGRRGEDRSEPRGGPLARLRDARNDSGHSPDWS